MRECPHTPLIAKKKLRLGFSTKSLIFPFGIRLVILYKIMNLLMNVPKLAVLLFHVLRRFLEVNFSQKVFIHGEKITILRSS
jgi:hypothetical protein